MKLIMENAVQLDGYIEDEINEATGNTEKNYYISGIFSTPEVKNRNGRFYPRSIWEREVQNYQKEIKERSINTLGEWMHPPRSTVDPLKAVIRIVELKINEDGNVWGKAKILNDNTERTNKLKGLIKEGVKIGVSSRGVGKVSATGVVESFKLITYDVVDMPSDYNAMLNGVVEGYQIVDGIVQGKEFYIDEETGCIGECSLEPQEDSDISEKIFDGKAKIGKKIITQTILAKDNIEAEEKFIKMIKLQQKNGRIPQGEIEDIVFENDTSDFVYVKLLKSLLGDKGADKLCDLPLEDKEEILSAFVKKVIELNNAEKPEESKELDESDVSKVEESSLTDDEIALKLIEALRKIKV